MSKRRILSYAIVAALFIYIIYKISKYLAKQNQESGYTKGKHIILMANGEIKHI